MSFERRTGRFRSGKAIKKVRRGHCGCAHFNKGSVADRRRAREQRLLRAQRKERHAERVEELE